MGRMCPYLPKEEDDQLKEECGVMIWNVIATEMLKEALGGYRCVKTGLHSYRTPQRCSQCFHEGLRLRVFYEKGSTPKVKELFCPECEWSFSFSFFEKGGC